MGLVLALYGASSAAVAAPSEQAPEQVASGAPEDRSDATHALRRIAGQPRIPAHPGPAEESWIQALGLATTTQGEVLVADRSGHLLRVDARGRLSGAVTTEPDGSPSHHPLGWDFDGAGVRDVSVAGEHTYVATGTQVYRLAGDGTPVLVAGSGEPGEARPGRATASPLSPDAIAVGAEGTVYVADTAHHRILQISPQGRLEVLAGTGEEARPGSVPPGPADRVALTPHDLALAPDGGLLVLSHHPSTDFVVDDGVTYGGTGGALLLVDGGRAEQLVGTGRPGTPRAGEASSSPLGCPGSLAVATTGEVWISDPCAQSLVVVDAGRLTVAVGNPGAGLSHVVHVGPVESSGLRPGVLGAGADGSVLVADTGSVYAVHAGVLSQVAGPPWGDPRQEDPLAATMAVEDTAVGPDGTLYLADIANDLVTAVDPGGRMRVVAGTGERGPAVDGPALESPLDSPESVDVDDRGNVYVGLHGSFQVVRISPDGRLRVLPYGGGTMSDLAADGDGSVYVVDCFAHVVWRVREGQDPTVFLDRSSQLPGGSGGFLPWSVAVAGEGRVLVGDQSNGLLLEASRPGRATLLAGAGESAQGWYLQEGQTGRATATRLSPSGLDVGPDGSVYIADALSLVRLGTAGDLVALVDSDLPEDSSNNSATSVSVDPEGSVYLSRWANGGVWEVIEREVVGEARRDLGVELVARRATRRFLLIEVRVHNLGARDEQAVQVRAETRRGARVGQRVVDVTQGDAQDVVLKVPVRRRGGWGTVSVRGADGPQDADPSNDRVRVRY